MFICFAGNCSRVIGCCQFIPKQAMSDITFFAYYFLTLKCDCATIQTLDNFGVSR
jgi:hypothetical protein